MVDFSPMTYRKHRTFRKMSAWCTWRCFEDILVYFIHREIIPRIIFFVTGLLSCLFYRYMSHKARFMWPTWGPPRSCWPQVGPMLAPWTLLLGVLLTFELWGDLSLPYIAPDNLKNINGSCHLATRSCPILLPYYHRQVTLTYPKVGYRRWRIKSIRS